MPTPVHRRPLPDHVEIPVLPDGMAAWFDLVRRAEGMETRWKREHIDLDHVVDGLSAAHALSGYRYSGRNGEWLDEAGAEPGQWRPEWIVLGGMNGDPFIADLSCEGIPVLLAEHGAGEWRPESVHSTLTGFIEAITVSEPEPVEEYVPPEPLPRDASLTVLDWGPERSRLVNALVKHHPNLYQRHMFRRKVETPVVLTRRMNRWQADTVQQIIASHGGQAEIGTAMPKQPRRHEPPAPQG